MRGYIKNKIYYKKENENEKLKIFGGCWTVNLDEVNLTSIDKIFYITSKNNYIINTDLAWKKGILRIFNGERKLCVPLKHWDIKKDKK